MGDRTEVIFVFESQPDAVSFEQALRKFAKAQLSESTSSSYEYVYWTNDGMNPSEGDRVAVAETLANPELLGCSVSLRGEALQMDIGHSIGSNWNSVLAGIPHLELSLPRHRFDSDDTASGNTENRDDHRARFVDALEILANELAPKCGYGSDNPSASEYPLSLSEVNDRRVKRLFKYNLYSKPAVQRIGRQYLLDTPAWYVSELDTGAVLLIVNPPGTTHREANKFEETTTHLSREFETSQS